MHLGSGLPEVSSNDQNGEEVTLSSYKGAAWTVVFFYPKADTPGCVRQACSLRDSYQDLVDQKVQVIGVSMNSVSEQKTFAHKYKLPFSLLSDPQALIIDAFGVPKLSLLKVAKRQVFLFRKGKLVWRDFAASTSQQAQDILTQIAKES